MEKRILIVYYSDSGHTKEAAEYMGNATDAVIETISTNAFGQGIWGYMKRGWYALLKKSVPINEVKYDPIQFDMLIVGTPVWAGHIASPIRRYLADLAGRSGKLPEIAFFVTLGGQGDKRALQEMCDIVGKEPIRKLELTDSDRKMGRDVNKMDGFVSSLTSHIVQFPQANQA